jgi:hypothetical protein
VLNPGQYGMCTAQDASQCCMTKPLSCTIIFVCPHPVLMSRTLTGCFVSMAMPAAAAEGATEPICSAALCRVSSTAYRRLCLSRVSTASLQQWTRAGQQARRKSTYTAVGGVCGVWQAVGFVRGRSYYLRGANARVCVLAPGNM